MTRKLWTLPALWLMLGASPALAETVELHASISPSRLGAPVSLASTVSFSSPTAGSQPPVVHVTMYGPEGMSVDTRGAGSCTASPAKVEAVGPSACPADSRVGFGQVTGLQELAHELIPGPFTLEFFLRPREAGHLALLIYVSAVTPVAEQFVILGQEVRAPAPYGLGLSFAVPTVATLPGASPGWVDHLSVSLGAPHVAYWRVIHGKRKLLHVRGLLAPKRCPAGGFPIEGQFEFADGSSTISATKIPCPRR